MPETDKAPIEAPLHERIRQFRESKGLTRDDLAEMIGVTSITLYRWETGSTRPSPLAAEKLSNLGVTHIAPGDTNVLSVPRLKKIAPGTSKNLAANNLQLEFARELHAKNKQLTIVPAPFVRNGPPDQTDFHNRLIDMQATSDLPVAEVANRLSLVESTTQFGASAQHQLEKPKATALSWNSNYGSHGWHRYVGRFPPHLVRSILNSFGATSNSVVCDPFLGSGTTAVECRLLGIPFHGIEICPLSAMISRAKSQFPVTLDHLISVATNYSNFFEDQRATFNKEFGTAFSHQQVMDKFGEQLPPFTNVEKWFTPQALLGTSISVAFGMTLNGITRDLFFTALSSKMRSIGNVDVDVVRAEYSKKPRVNVDVERLVTRSLKGMMSDIQRMQQSHAHLIGEPSSIQVVEGSALDVDLPKGSISHIITSPPYGVEAISYLRTHLLSYRSLAKYLEHDPYDTRDKTIGSEYLDETHENAGSISMRISHSFRAFFGESHSSLDKREAQRRLAMMQFCDDMRSIGERMAHWLKPGGKVAYIIGNKRLGQRIIPMDRIISELFQSVGLVETGTISHKLKTNNSNSQVPWQERVIQEEHIMFFERR